MIKYKLKCKNCEKNFDSWFSSSLEFEKLKNKKFLNCHFCGSKKIDKNLMAPNILNSVSKIEKKAVNKKRQNIKKKIWKFKTLLNKNFKMLETILLTKQDHCITTTKKNKKEFTEMHQENKLKSYKKKALKLKLFLGLKTKIIKFF